MTAREFFQDVAKAVAEHREAELALLYGPPRRPGAPGGGGVSSPVEARVESNEKAREVMAATEEVIGRGLRRIEELRAVFGESRAEAVELHYIDLVPWDDVAAEMGVGRATVFRWCDLMFDWIDSYGWARLALGVGTADDSAEYRPALEGETPKC